MALAGLAAGSLLLGAGCAGRPAGGAAGAPEADPTAAAPAAPASARDPAVVDAVGSDVFLDPQSQGPSPLPGLFEAWVRAAGLEPGDPRLVYTFTGDGGGMALFCRLRGPLRAEQLRDALDGLEPEEPAHATASYALGHLPHLYDATLALLARRPTPEEAAGCRAAGVAYAELALGEAPCDGGRTCPAVLLLKPERLGNPLARRLLEAVAADPGLLGDAAALEVAGVVPLGAARAARIRGLARELLAPGGLSPRRTSRRGAGCRPRSGTGTRGRP